MEMTLIVVAFLMGANDGHSQIQTQSKAAAAAKRPNRNNWLFEAEITLRK